MEMGNTSMETNLGSLCVRTLVQCMILLLNSPDTTAFLLWYMNSFSSRVKNGLPSFGGYGHKAKGSFRIAQNQLDEQDIYYNFEAIILAPASHS